MLYRELINIVQKNICYIFFYKTNIIYSIFIFLFVKDYIFLPVHMTFTITPH